MATTQDGTIAELQRTIAELRRERDVARSREATLTEALTQRNSEYGERIEQQAAIIDVLKVMSGSPGDPQPVFDLIVERARDLCEGYGATVLEFDGRLLLHRASTGIDDDPAIRDAIIAAYPKAPVRSWPIDLALLERRLIIVDDLEAEPNLDPALRNLTHKSVVSMPLMRGEVALGALALAGRERGGFSDSQIELLKTFAEQAVIAITSAETYRALQTRTADLQESLEYQTATSDVLKVISRSTFDLQPVLDTVVETAARLCDAEQALISQREGELARMVANFGFPPEYETYTRGLGAFPIDPKSPAVAQRVLAEGCLVHVRDVAAVPGYWEIAIRLGKQRTTLGVPLLREGRPVGVIVLARQRVEPFTDRQIELVSTFADQAVIAIENTRLITEQHEALEQQTATAEVLQVINASPGDLAPVFDTMLEKALRLCDAAFGNLWTYDGEVGRLAAICGASPEYRAELMRAGPQKPEPGGSLIRLVEGEPLVHIADIAAEGAHRSGAAVRRMLADCASARTVLWVPMRKDAALLGFFTVYRTEVRPFTDKQIALLQNFAAQAVIAMENARLITETREALEQQTATAEVLQVINVSPGNLAPVFDAMLEKAMRLSGAAYGVLRSYDGEHLHMLASRGVPTEYAEFLARSGGPGTPGDSPMPGTAPMQALETRQPAQRLDVRESIGYTSGIPGTRAIADLGGARTCLHVPLVKDQVAVGLLTFYRQEVRAFSDKQIALLQNFAAQAVIAMENARLITEQREALEQQTATAEVLQVINASPGNLAPVFDTMLENALRLCRAGFGTLYTYDGKHFQPVAFRGVAPGFAELLTKHPPTDRPGSPAARVLETKRPVDVPNVMDEENYRSGVPTAVGMVEVGGFRAFINVPLVKDGKVLGLFTIYRQVVGKLSDKQIALLQNFAAQAVIAMENARLITEQREALEQQTATAEVLQVINASPGSLMPVFDAMLEKAMRLCEAAFGSLYTYDGERFRTAAQCGVPPAYAEHRAITPPTARSGSPLARLVETKRAVHILDLAMDEGYLRGDATGRALLDIGGARTALMVPLLKDESVIGAIVIYRQEVRAFSDKQFGLVENFAAQAVIAMESARLLQELRARTNELAQRQDELRVTFENMGDGVAMFDETPSLVAWNRKFQDILDLPDGVLAERLAFPDYIRYLAERGEYGAGADPEEQIRRLTGQAGQVRAYERTRPDGRVIEIRRNPVPSGGFVLIFSDISERKRSEAEIRAARDAAEEASRTIEAAYRDLKTAQANLIQAEKMASLGQLTAGIAHEIKNPLNFVNNFAALSVDLLSELKETAAPGFAALTDNQRAEIEDVSAMLTSNLEKITEHGKRADGIVKAMLEHSRGSSAERRIVDLNTLIDEALNLAYHGARAQDQSFNIALERDFDVGIAPIEVNPQDMTRVFLNIFSNGFYASSKRARNGGDTGFVPTLKVATRDASETVEIRVRDNGTGIPSEIRDKLFQPFFTTKPTGEGTGLGLSITYDIVTKQHGGTITVDSKVDTFTEFVVTLPRQMFANSGSRA